MSKPDGFDAQDCESAFVSELPTLLQIPIITLAKSDGWTLPKDKMADAKKLVFDHKNIFYDRRELF